MKYTHKYKKLSRDKYTTIRRYSKGKVGDVVLEIYPGGSHKAKIIKIERKTINGLPFHVLYLDTDCITRQGVRELFQSFYGKEIDFDKEKFYLYHLKKV